MSSITFDKVSKIYTKDGEEKTVIDAVDLEIQQGEFTIFVGPSGCGKSTMLRMVSGLETVSKGELKFNGEVVNDKSPSERGIGMVFQSYALYPHMTIAENIAFPLKMAGKSQEEIDPEVNEVAEMLEITHLLKNKPGQLSGGQRQRVAIGRALVRHPEVFLLDEPLSNLDAALRGRMRLSIAEYHKRLGCTIIYVTHDQTEAMTLADKVVVLRGGHIEQVGSPMELYEHPRTKFVAEFIGSPQMNMVPATYLGEEDGCAKVSIAGFEILADVDTSKIKEQPGEQMLVGLRPEELSVGSDNAIRAQVVEQEYMGSESLLYVKIKDFDEPVMVRCPGNLVVDEDSEVNIHIEKDACYLFGADELAIPRNSSIEDNLVRAEQIA